LVVGDSDHESFFTLQIEHGWLPEMIIHAAIMLRRSIARPAISWRPGSFTAGSGSAAAGSLKSAAHAAA
ncbi:MAG TPA: hypothetical protein VER68_03610, partial [Azonexus sp.]|nr:hypothetical protein [Azonexus sp.]